MIFILLSETAFGWAMPAAGSQRQYHQSTTQQSATKQQYDYDLIIIGAGASGLFASGASSSLGSKTLLLDQADGCVGGDCSNAACVPSKAVRSVARMAKAQNENTRSWLDLALHHSNNTVIAVRQRENASEIMKRSPNLDVVFVKDCHFVSPHELELTPRNNSIIPWREEGSFSSIDNINDNNTNNMTFTVTSKQFLIATGASPVVPQHLKEAAQVAGVPIYTYRSVLQPNNTSKSIWKVLQKPTATRTDLIIAGGGPTACELGQSLARLGGNDLNVTIVAPEVLPKQDVTLRRAAMKVLPNDGITLRLGSRCTNVTQGFVELDDGRDFLPVDALLLCLGRSPETSLATLNLSAAGVQWNAEGDVEVRMTSLRSKTAPNVYACGDCCDAVHERRAAHAAWTGFHAARNTVRPFWLRMGCQAIHPVVPAVIFTDPELASVGLSYADCVRKYGRGGFDSLYVPEEGMDRADMERLERPVIRFVELRATKIRGKILGMTACGPAAAELANEVGLAIMSGLTVRDMARAIHSYPSHGYLLHRIALALATSNVWG